MLKKIKILWVGLIILLVNFHAQAELWTYAQIHCNIEKSTLTISEILVEDEGDIVRIQEAETKPLDDLMKLATGNNGDYKIKDKDWLSSCSIGGSQYKIKISPWKYNSRVNGMCGGGSPSIELSVERKRDNLAKGIVFSGSCDGTWNEKLLIESITFDESRALAKFVFTNYGEDRRELEIPYTELNRLQRSDLWAVYQKSLTSP